MSLQKRARAPFYSEFCRVLRCPALCCPEPQALEPLLEALCEAALKHTEKSGRKDITEDDLKAVSSKIFAAKKK